VKTKSHGGKSINKARLLVAGASDTGTAQDMLEQWSNLGTKTVTRQRINTIRKGEKKRKKSAKVIYRVHKKNHNRPEDDFSNKSTKTAESERKKMSEGR